MPNLKMFNDRKFFKLFMSGYDFDLRYHDLLIITKCLSFTSKFIEKVLLTPVTWYPYISFYSIYGNIMWGVGVNYNDWKKEKILHKIRWNTSWIYLHIVCFEIPFFTIFDTNMLDKYVIRRNGFSVLYS